MLAVFALSACRQSDNNARFAEDPVFQNINRYLDWESQNGFSGFISIQFKDKPLFSRAFGYANKERGTAFANSTVIDIGSLTKQFTAAGILKLEMEGLLSVNDSLGKFYPDISGDKEFITIHQLLTHTSGLRKSLGYDYERANKSDFLGKLFASDLVSKPGEKYNYSHAGYSLLGAIIEQISGMNYEKYLSDKLFKPAGMEKTGYVIPMWEENQVAHGYSKCKDWGKPMDMPWAADGPYWNLKANGGMLSCSSDLMAWMQAIRGNHILDEQATEKMFFPHVKEGDFANSFYSYGWVTSKSLRNTDVIFHNGGNRRFYTDIIRYPSEDVTILVLSNLDKPGNGNISWELAKIIFWPDYEAQVQGIMQECMDSLPDNRMGEVAGKLMELLKSDEAVGSQTQLGEIFSEYLINKHAPEHIYNVLNDLKASCRNIRINNIIISDHRIMELILYHMEDSERKNLYLRLVLDEEDNYLIRVLVYDSMPR